MDFNQLVSLYEAKGTKPGERFFNAKNNEGPSGIGSSPIGKSNYNPELPERKVDNSPKDTGMRDAVEIIRILAKGLQLLKNDDTFEHQVKGIMNGFKKNRNQISAYQESVLKTKPKIIDNLWGEINRLTKILNNPSTEVQVGKTGKDLQTYKLSGKTTKDREEFQAALNKAIASKDEHEAELHAVYDAVENVTKRNEEANNEYLEQLMTVIKHTTKRLFTQLQNQMAEESDQPHKMKPITMNELDWDMLEKQVSKDAMAQLQLLEMLMSPEVNKNPLISFMDIQERRYDEAKDRYYQLKKGDNYSITTDQLYNNLPLFQFINYMSHAALKAPKIGLTTKQKQIAKNAASGDDMMTTLGNISNERQFDDIKPELLNYIDGLDIDEAQKSALRALANGKFVTRKGAPNAAFKIRSSLKSSQINESFDSLASRILRQNRFDVTDFKLNLMEVLGK